MRAEAIVALLPQHQCRRCGFEGCRPYAEAIAAGKIDINRCPPGGKLVIRALAELLDREPKPLAADVEPVAPASIARIDETVCIGCTKCLPACPVDAIVGAPKLLHEVMDAACTGCGLCIPPCPVDCIELVPVEDEAATERRLNPSSTEADAAHQSLARHSAELRARYARHNARLVASKRRRKRALDRADADDLAARRSEIAAAVARVRARRRTMTK
ncbi:MAG: RnfABCDGE type electron transport complex subunit B [Gammaproteobacteria bacterium]